MSLHLKALPSLSDNYIWLIINDADSSAIIIDPGRSEPCTRFLTQENINPIAILVTHRHWDHVEGIEKLVEVYDLPV
ncbi:MAG: MBL fold metallo-hydrolase, partial [Gammaproteobacteria bacterium]|nr:MBL fold metallo-hydrolase [Gammaproteobacteria bacterium]